MSTASSAWATGSPPPPEGSAESVAAMWAWFCALPLDDRVRATSLCGDATTVPLLLQMRDEAPPEFCCSAFPTLRPLCLEWPRVPRQAEEKLLGALRIGVSDTVTLHRALLRSPSAFRGLMWNDKQYHTLGNFVASLVERAMWVRYYESHAAQDPRADPSCGKRYAAGAAPGFSPTAPSPSNTVPARTLAAFWHDLPPPERCAVMRDAREAVAQMWPALGPQQFAECRALLEDLPLLAALPERSQRDCDVAEMFFASPLECAGSTRAAVLRAIGRFLRETYIRKLSSDLINDERWNAAKKKRRGASARQQQGSTPRKHKSQRKECAGAEPTSPGAAAASAAADAKRQRRKRRANAAALDLALPTEDDDDDDGARSQPDTDERPADSLDLATPPPPPPPPPPEPVPHAAKTPPGFTAEALDLAREKGSGAKEQAGNRATGKRSAGMKHISPPPGSRATHPPAPPPPLPSPSPLAQSRQRSTSIDSEHQQKQPQRLAKQQQKQQQRGVHLDLAVAQTPRGKHQAQRQQQQQRTTLQRSNSQPISPSLAAATPAWSSAMSVPQSPAYIGGVPARVVSPIVLAERLPAPLQPGYADPPHSPALSSASASDTDSGSPRPHPQELVPPFFPTVAPLESVGASSAVRKMSSPSPPKPSYSEVMAGSAPAVVHMVAPQQQQQQGRVRQMSSALDLAASSHMSSSRGGVLKPTYLSTLLNKSGDDAQYYDPLDLATAKRTSQLQAAQMRRSGMAPQQPPVVQASRQAQRRDQGVFLDFAAPPSRAPASTSSAPSPAQGLLRPQPQRAAMPDSAMRPKSWGPNLTASLQYGDQQPQVPPSPKKPQKQPVAPLQLPLQPQPRQPAQSQGGGSRTAPIVSPPIGQPLPPPRAEALDLAGAPPSPLMTNGGRSPRSIQQPGAGGSASRHLDLAYAAAVASAEPNLTLPPWVPAAYAYAGVTPAVAALAAEVADYCRYVERRFDESKGVYQMMLKRIANVATRLLPGSSVVPFGSYATSLCIPTSDLDLVCVLPSDQGSLDRRASFRVLVEGLRGESWVSWMKPIETAAIPVIKLMSKAEYIPTDVTFTIRPSNGADDDRGVEADGAPKHRGLRNSDMVKSFLRDLRSFKPILLVLKQLLYERGLNNTYTGGLGSFCLSLMVASYLQVFDSHQAQDLGSLLVGFLSYYGTVFDYRTTGISTRNGGSHFRLGDPGHFSGVGPIVIEDPWDPNTNVASGVFSMWRVRSVFEGAHAALLSPTPTSEDSPTILSRILREWTAPASGDPSPAAQPPHGHQRP
eukprot:m51a1_g13887 hypothetical protein (1283) ;mRNA; f:664538-669641